MGLRLMSDSDDGFLDDPAWSDPGPGDATDVETAYQLRERGAPMVVSKFTVRWGAWSPGEIPVLATGTDDGKVRLWDGRDGRQLRESLPAPSSSIWGSWSKTGRESVLASGDDSGDVWFWGTDGSRPRLAGVSQCAENGQVVWGAWTPIGHPPALATGYANGTCWVESETDWGPIPSSQEAVRGERVLSQRAGSAPDEGAASLWGSWCPSAGTRILALGDARGTVRFVDVQACNQFRFLGAHTGSVNWGAWSVVGGQPVLATGGDDAIIRVYFGVDGNDQIFSRRHRAPIQWGSWSVVNGVPTLAAGASDGTVQFWQFPHDGADLAAPVADLYAGAAPKWGKWARVGERPMLAVGGGNGTVRLWDGLDGRWLTEGGDAAAARLNWGAWGNLDGVPVLATGDDDGAIRLWELVIEHSVRRRPVYRSDESEGSDRLNRNVEATALADLLLSRSARPPLAVGLFGEWGEGKSYFLRLLSEQVTEIAKREDAFTHHNVRQIRFNAWHYAETDLWASLVAEIFAQLAGPTEGHGVGEEQREQSRLVSEIVAERRLPERIAAERDRAESLRGALKPPPWNELSDSARGDLVTAIDQIHPDLLQDAYRTATAPWAWLQLQHMRMSKIWAELPRRAKATAALTILVVAVLATVLAVVPDISAKLLALGGVFVSAVTGLATLWKSAQEQIASASTEVKNAVKRVTKVVRSWQDEVRVALKVSEDNVGALERELQSLTAAGQLAGFVTEQAVEGGYRQTLGLMTQIRQDFETMSKLLTRDDGEQSDGVLAGLSELDSGGDAVPRIDRIVLYIDDLDRCPPNRVVELLEAVHLLLAVRLFVVVVAVDPRWLMRAIGWHYREVLGPLATGRNSDDTDRDDEYWASTPAQYLEKIFQVVFTLPAMTEHGYTNMLDSVIGPRADIDYAAIAAALFDEPDVKTSTIHWVANQPTEVNLPALDSTKCDSFVGDGTDTTELPPARPVERIDPLALDGAELALMRLLGPPLITTPRAVKRLANSYGLLAAINRLQEPAESGGTLPAMVLLAAVIGFPNLSARLLTHVHRTGVAAPDLPWTDFVHRLHPVRAEQGWTIRGTSEVVAEAEAWQTLAIGLDRIGGRAARAGVPLPDTISGWADWIPLVGRLSFPGGSVAARLDRFGAASARNIDDMDR
jgi:WD40 repeat protein